MRNLALTTLALVFTLGLTSCSQPLGTFPGGKLEGTLAEPPAAWSQVPDTIQLEVRPDDPYSVNLWAVVAAGHLYVSSSRNPTWAQRIDADPRVRLRIGQALYPLSAARVTSAAELGAVAAAHQAKYNSSLPADPASVRLYRLSPR